MLPAEQVEKGEKRERVPTLNPTFTLSKRPRNQKETNTIIPNLKSLDPAEEANHRKSSLPAGQPISNHAKLSVDDLWNLAIGDAEWSTVYDAARHSKHADAVPPKVVHHHVHHHFHHVQGKPLLSHQLEGGESSTAPLQLPRRFGLSSLRSPPAEPFTKLPTVANPIVPKSTSLPHNDLYWRSYGSQSGRSYYLDERKLKPGEPNEYNLLTQVEKARKPYRDMFDYKDPDHGLKTKMASSSKDFQDTVPPLAWPWFISKSPQLPPEHWTGKLQEIEVGRLKKFIKQSFTNSEADLEPYLERLSIIDLLMMAQVRPNLRAIDSMLKQHNIPVTWTSARAAQLAASPMRSLASFTMRQTEKDVDPLPDKGKGKRPPSDSAKDKGKRPKED